MRISSYYIIIINYLLSRNGRIYEEKEHRVKSVSTSLLYLLIERLSRLAISSLDSSYKSDQLIHEYITLLLYARI